MRNSLILLVLAMLLRMSAFAGEGMWIPLFLKSLNEKEMKGMGMKMSAEDIYSTNKSSLKDAIVHFGGFCTSEIVSPNGLLLTNHHCGYGQIQSHSTVENNLLKDGFWAANYSEELPCSGLSATFIVSIEDVTEQVLMGIGDDLSGKDREDAVNTNIAKIKEAYTRVNFKDLQIKPYFKGNQYFAIETVTYPDVRLVGNPPESIGKFGADTDNWVWPRHTGDFAFFRIYANANNEPANYSEENVPYTPKHFLPISIDGVEEDDFTLVFGFPGRTNQYLPSVAVDQIANVYNPAKIAMREAALDVMDREMRKDEATRLQYASKFARIANYWKKWIGEATGIEKTGGVERKKEYEAMFSKRVKKKKKFRKKYSTILSDVSEAFKTQEPYKLAYDMGNEMLVRNVEIFRQTRQVDLLKGSLENYGQDEYNTVRTKFKESVEGWYGKYRSDIDQEVLAGQISTYLKYCPQDLVWPGIKEGIEKHGNAESYTAHMFSKSFMSSYETLAALLDSSPEKFLVALINDPLYQFYVGYRDHFREAIAAPYSDSREEIEDLMRVYMKAQMEVLKKKKRFYPDANSTLRVTYGQVKGYTTEEAGTYEPMTYLDGVIAKYKPGDYEFDVHPKLIELHESKDYGQYATADGRLPVCFIGSNHTSGGNSGSPAIDAHGNLIGLNFDRVWEGTMSDVNYDPSICRNIMVDIRYVLFVVDKFAGAGHLVDEMKLVRPKTGK